MGTIALNDLLDRLEHELTQRYIQEAIEEWDECGDGCYQVFIGDYVIMRVRSN